MSRERAVVVFFDIGGTLATVRPGTGSGQIVLEIRPGVISVLGNFRNEEIRLGIISNTPAGFTREMMQAALETANIHDFFSPTLLIYSSVVGIQKDSVVIFCFAADRAGLAHQRNRCVFVGENSRERHYAREAGFRMAAQPDEALDVALGVR